MPKKALIALPASMNLWPSCSQKVSYKWFTSQGIAITKKLPVNALFLKEVKAFSFKRKKIGKKKKESRFFIEQTLKNIFFGFRFLGGISNVLDDFKCFLSM